MLILVLGALNVPLGAADLPLKFKRLLVPGKIQQIYLTGNCTSFGSGGSSGGDYLRTISQQVYPVQGPYDTPSPQTPLHRVFEPPGSNLRLGLVHGYSVLPWGDLLALEQMALELDVDVLLTGSPFLPQQQGFHAIERNGRFYVYPGSASGSYLSIPSSCVLLI
jgi:vacuolar protein sorting-associated protein 29